MEIITSDSENLTITREKIELSDGLRLVEDACFYIGYGENADPQADFRAVTLLCQSESAGGSTDYAAVFREQPPEGFLDGVAVAAVTLAKGMVDGAEEGGEGVDDLLDLAANRALTPKAKLAIERHGSMLDLWLIVGEWEGLRRVKFERLAHLFVR